MLDSARVTLNVSAKVDVQIADALRRLLDGRHAVARLRRTAYISGVQFRFSGERIARRGILYSWND
jgi:hypothetical protein